MNAKVSIFVALRGDGILVHVFNVKAEQTLEWFKAHADELAKQVLPGVDYVALNVEAA